MSGMWLGTEDKKLYELQTKSNGEIGYTTTKDIPCHPAISAQIKINEAANNRTAIKTSSTPQINSSLSSNEELGNLYVPNEEEFKLSSKHKAANCSTKAAVQIVTTAKASSRNAAKICKELVKSGVNIPTPSQPGILKAARKVAERLEEDYKTTPKYDVCCLHFDGKKIEKKEVQAVVLKNQFKEIRLTVLILNDGKSSTVFEGIKRVLNDFHLWDSIKMIVCDTTNVNTGKTKGVVSSLQKQFIEKKLPPPQYVGCQQG